MFLTKIVYRKAIFELFWLAKIILKLSKKMIHKNCMQTKKNVEGCNLQKLANKKKFFRYTIF